MVLAQERGEFRIERIKKFLHCFRSFISHVGDPEGLSFDFSVTAVDGESVLLNDGFDPARLIQVIGSNETGKRL